jgi:cation-transporting ATPase 13A1
MPREFALLRKRPLALRYDIIVFSILYLLTVFPSLSLLRAHWISAEPTEHTNGTFAFIVDHLDIPQLEPYTFTVVLPFLVGFLHILVFLLATWWIKFASFLYYIRATADSATHVRFMAKAHRGSSEIVPFDRTTQPPTAVYQQKKREFIDGKFVPLTYPTHLTFGEYLDSRGLKQHSDVPTRTNYYGPNSYDVPVPTFLQLLKEHTLAPFFVFQVFSILCWMLDQYFIYPLLMLASLLMIEANTVRTRHSNLLELRGVKHEAILVHARRDDEWRRIPSNKLLPGDLVLLTDSEVICPADILVLSGRAIANEAMLTGESTPQVKESVDALPRDQYLDTVRDTRHILFGGTRICQLMPADQPHIYTPARGVAGYVLCTGLGSAQGRLIRTILFASQRVAAESKDAMKLLIFLTVFAVAASGYVVYHGLKSGTVSTYRLIVEVILICTSTIPPDLPMELTFSVNASLLALSKLLMFCTEPFRIPFAGTVSVCCFDKTGTITA